MHTRCISIMSPKKNLHIFLHNFSKKNDTSFYYIFSVFVKYESFSKRIKYFECLLFFLIELYTRAFTFVFVFNFVLWPYLWDCSLFVFIFVC